MELRRLAEELEARVGNPERGLPEAVFLLVSRWTPMVNVDLLVRDEAGRFLLSWRVDPYYPAGWHVPGGIIRSKETMADRIAAVAAAELGAAADFDSRPLAINEIIHPDRRERGHFISFLFACRLKTAVPPERLYAGGAVRHGDCAWFEDCPPDLLEVHGIYRKFLVKGDCHFRPGAVYFP